MKAIVVETFGGPEVLREVDIEQPEPQPHQVPVRVSVAGVNFLDVYQRTGATPVRPPFRAGVEGVVANDSPGCGSTTNAKRQRDTARCHRLNLLPYTRLLPTSMAHCHVQ